MTSIKSEPEVGHDAGYGQIVTQETRVKPELDEQHVFGDNIYGDDGGYNNGYNQQQNQQSYQSLAPPNDYGHTGTVGIKEDG